MKQELKLLATEVEKKVGKPISVSSDFEKLSAHISRHHVHLPSGALKKVWSYLKGAEHPSRETLDKLALFVVRGVKRNVRKQKIMERGCLLCISKSYEIISCRTRTKRNVTTPYICVTFKARLNGV